MPPLDDPSAVITRITRIDEGKSTTSQIPSYLAIHGLASNGQREVLMTETAARDLWTKLDGMFRHGMFDAGPSDFMTA